MAKINPLAGLQINQLITHHIFKKDGGEEIAPKFGKIQTLDYAPKQLFQQRIIEILGSSSRSLEMKVEKHGANTTFQSAASLLRCDPSVFERRSQELPKQLTKIQGGGIPSGLMFVFDGSLPNRKQFVGIIKARSGEGFSMQGNNLAFIEQLFLTKSKELYKGALFLESKKNRDSDDIRSPEDFQVFVYDESMLRSPSGQPRDYFVKKFLGCCALENAAEQTALFFNKTHQFISNQTSIQDSERFELESELYRYVESSTPDISVSFFASKFEDLSDEYSAYMNTAGVSAISISKNTSTIPKNKLNMRSVRLDQITVKASSEYFANMIEIDEDEDKITLRIKKS